MHQNNDGQIPVTPGSAQHYRTLLETIPHMVWMANAEGRVEYANRQWFEYTNLGIEHPGQMEWDYLLHPEDRDRTWSAWNQARQDGSTFEIVNRLKRAADGSYRWHLVRAVPFRGAAGEITNWFGTCTEIEKQKQAESVHLEKERQQGVAQLAAGVAHDFNNLLVVIIGGASFAMESLPPAHRAQNLLQGVVRAGERAAELTAKILAYAGQGTQHLERTDFNKLVRETCDSARAFIPKTIELRLQTGPEVPPVMTDSRQMRQVIADLVMNGVESIREGAAGTISVRTKTTEVDEESMEAVTAGQYVELEVRDTGCGMDEETLKKAFDPFFTTKFVGRGLGLAAVHGFVRSSGGLVQVDSAPGKGTRFRILLPAVPVEARSSGAAS